MYKSRQAEGSTDVEKKKLAHVLFIIQVHKWSIILFSCCKVLVGPWKCFFLYEYSFYFSLFLPPSLSSDFIPPSLTPLLSFLPSSSFPP